MCTQTPYSHFLALNHTRRIGLESMSLAKQNVFFLSCASYPLKFFSFQGFTTYKEYRTRNKCYGSGSDFSIPDPESRVKKTLVPGSGSASNNCILT